MKTLRFSFLLIFSLFFVSIVSAEMFGYGTTKELPINYSNIIINETSNQSEYWNTNIGSLGNANDTQFENNDGTLSIISSWINSLSFWKRTGTILSPKTIGDGISIADLSVTDLGLTITSSGIIQDVVTSSGVMNIELSAFGQIVGSMVMDGNINFDSLFGNYNFQFGGNTILTVAGDGWQGGTRMIFGGDEDSTPRMLFHGEGGNGVLDWDSYGDNFEFIDDVFFDKNIYLKDNNGAFFGDGKDVKEYFDGSDYIVNAELGSPNIKFTNFNKYIFDNISYFGDGGTTDYLETKADGEVELHGTARVKNIVTMDWYTGSMGGGGENVIYGRDADDSTDEYTILTVYVPLDIDTSQDITVKWRWAPTLDQTGDKKVRWRNAYNFVGNSGVIGASSGYTYETVDLSTDEVKRTIHETSQTISGVSAGDFLSFILYRDADHVEDTCVGDVFTFLNFQLEYTSNKLGEAT